MTDRSEAHRPVLRDEVVEMMAPAGRGVLVDCTVGAGGHAEALLAAAGPDARLIAIDVDEANLRLTKCRLKQFMPRCRLFHANFSELPSVLAAADVTHADAVLTDLGVSSNQLDDPLRGLSFLTDGPLDMRLDVGLERTAADIVNSLAEKELADLIYAYGEERYSRRIARSIVAARKQRRIDRTGRLAEVVAAAMPAAVRRTRRGVHPATRTFQALRIAVNDELGNLQRLLNVMPKLLADGGRVAIISFHSLEDRCVKQTFADWAADGRARLLVKKPVTASPHETKVNPRSRSAKLRGVEWIR